MSVIVELSELWPLVVGNPSALTGREEAELTVSKYPTWSWTMKPQE